MIAYRGQLDATREELRYVLRAARAPRIRSRLEFAEAEIIHPTGKYAGHKFRADRQPYARLFLDACDRGPWRRRFATGPTQSGKTLTAFVIPILYHLFERQETVVVGLPNMDIAGDKFREDLLPVIERTRYAALLPASGAGSRGGTNPVAIRFRNGATLRFMSAGGGDKKRSAFTSRVLVLTEVDGYDEAGDSSREADQVAQLEGRTLSFGESAEVYGECTVSIPEGRIWQEVTGGTNSRIVRPCPHCAVWVTPEREHLVGWDDAASELAAGDAAAFACPSCGECWTDAERFAANALGRLLHGEQSIDADGHVVGDPPRTKTLGFRWSAIDNHFWPSRLLGEKEWTAARAIDDETSKRELLQFFWTWPYTPPTLDATILDPAALQKRVAKVAPGQCPRETTALAIGVDVGKWLCHWFALAVKGQGESAGGHVPAYDSFEVPSDKQPEERALLVALRDFRDRLLAGFPQLEQTTNRLPDQVWIDSGYLTDVVYAFCRESGPRFRPTKGHGVGDRMTQYVAPKKATETQPWIFEGYHFAYQPAADLWLVHVNVDLYKSRVHSGLAAPPDAPGAIVLYEAEPRMHLKLSKHLTAEREVEEFVVGRGTVRRWKTLRHANHWFDAAVLARAAAHLCGFHRDPPQPAPRPAAQPEQESNRFTTPDGRPFLVTERNS